MNYDEDIKIFDGSKKLNKVAEVDIPDYHNLDKARRLGIALASRTKEAERGFELNINDELLLQRRLLLCFAIATALEDYSESIQYARTALNAFYDTIKRIESGFYEDIGSTGSFSFYYLARRQGGDIVRRIGQTFAMLCGQDGDPVCQELGEALYCQYTNMVKVQIKSIQMD